MPLRGEAQRPTYINLEQIRGGSQLLHRCEHAVLGSECVQKTVPISSGSVAFFEPRLLEELDHPHITPVREAQIDPAYPDYVTFVMPWYAGGSVAQALVEDRRFSLGNIVTVARNVLDALEYLHTRKGYVHRDVKPANILMNEDRRTGYLSDLGLAAALDRGVGTAPAVQSTFEYMAPECASTLRHGVEADIYGLGMTLFEMFNGRLRWEDFDRSKVERRVMKQERRALPDSAYAPSTFAPHVPDALVAIVRRAIDTRPSHRHASAAELLRALNGVKFIDWCHVGGEGIDGRWEGTWPPHLHTGDRDRYRVDSREMERGPSRGKRRLSAFYCKAGALDWRRIGIADRDIDADEASAVRAFFRDVAANAAHRRAAR